MDRAIKRTDDGKTHKEIHHPNQNRVSHELPFAFQGYDRQETPLNARPRPSEKLLNPLVAPGQVPGSGEYDQRPYGEPDRKATGSTKVEGLYKPDELTPFQGKGQDE